MPAPGLTEKLALRTSEGLFRRSSGYLRRPSVGSPAGALERTAVPSPGSTTMAFHPMRPGKVPSRSSTFFGSSTRAVSGSSTRVVFSPPCPSGCAIVAVPAGSRATRRPSTVNVSRRSTSACLRANSVASAVPRCWKVGISASSRM